MVPLLVVEAPGVRVYPAISRIPLALEIVSVPVSEMPLAAL